RVAPVMRNPFHRRRLLVRLALLFAIAQIIAAVSVILAQPGVRDQPLETVLLALLAGVDLALLAIFSGWLIRGGLSGPMQRLASDVQRIADGDYHHRVGESHRVELREIEQSVNRLADRLIADQRRLAQNIQSLEETNRELVALRDQMVHSAKLASVGTLAAGIAHEVGNPLGAITGFVDVARKRAERAGADTEILDFIRDEASRIDRIVRGLLDYARAPGANQQPSAAADVVLGVRILLESQGKLEGVEAVWEIAEDAADLVTEPDRLKQVLVNLLLNALDAVKGVGGARILVRLYGEEGETLRLPARREDDPPGVNYMHRRRLGDDDGGGDLVTRAARVTIIEVSDNGPGIRAEHLEKVFDPFFTTKEPGKGTGLGLSICARLVEGMGGQIEAGVAPGGGARFVIRLPGFIASEDALVMTSQLVEKS
ncbi:MAG TPA: ATP-binding protein, partial [Longimicrobiales bacterium]|nr:ATP-binding protein [Longimicrobiales bacterium]